MPEESDFDIAKEIELKLKGKDQTQQLRILRWVSESLGLQTASHSGSALGAPSQSADAFVPTPSSSLIAAERGTDIRSFSHSKSPSSETQVATVIAYYYKFIAPESERRDTINKEILVDAIRKIGGIRQPKSPKQTLINAKSQGYLDAADRGEYSINSVGENLIAMGMTEGNSPLRKKRTVPKKNKKSKKAR